MLRTTSALVFSKISRISNGAITHAKSTWGKQLFGEKYVHKFHSLLAAAASFKFRKKIYNCKV